MTWRRTLAGLVLVVISSTASSSQGRMDLPQNQPGMPTIAQIRVINTGPGEAVPIVFRGGGEPWPVSVIGVPSVTLLPNAVVATRGARQAWEYRQLSATPGDEEAALNAAGADGWEAVSGVMSGGRTVWTLKRPR